MIQVPTLLMTLAGAFNHKEWGKAANKLSVSIWTQRSALTGDKSCIQETGSLFFMQVLSCKAKLNTDRILLPPAQGKELCPVQEHQTWA